jgi:hypothetical protein
MSINHPSEIMPSKNGNETLMDKGLFLQRQRKAEGYRRE